MLAKERGSDTVYYDWKPSSMLEITLPSPDNFLKVKETLTRIGIASRKEKKLFQSAHILHKQGRYYIVHFKELFFLDNKDSNISVGDIERRNVIANLLHEWGLLSIVDGPVDINTSAGLSQIKIVTFKEKQEWDLIPKYNIGQRRTKETE